MSIKDVAQDYLKKVITSPFYFSKTPCKDLTILHGPFRDLLNASVSDFNEKYTDVEVLFVETYRSNTLQQMYFNSGASKIRKNGMHHYAIAVDCAFKINGKFTYNGDYKFLRQCFKDNGLSLLGLWDMGHVQYIPATATDQNALRNEVDRAIRKFQKDNGLISDGMIGPKTIAKAKEVFGIA